MTNSPQTPPLKSPDEHAKSVSGMFGRIAGFYDLLNHLLSFGMDVYWRRQLVRTVRTGEAGQVLDLAAGTLDVTLEILRRFPEQRVLAMDFSLPMLLKGRKKIPPRLKDKIDILQADGRGLPLPDQCVDSATIAFGIRNILPRSQALEELHRVLTPGGRLCILEFGTGERRVWKGLYNLYLERILPAIGKLVSGDPAAYRYLADTIKRFPNEKALAQEMRQAGFEKVFYRPMLSGVVYLHVGQKG